MDGGDLCLGGKLLPPGGWVRRGPIRRTSCALFSVSRNRGLHQYYLVAAATPCCHDGSLSRDDLSGHGQWGDFSGCASAVPAGDRRRVRSGGGGRGNWGLPVALGVGIVQRPDGDLFD